VIIILLASFSTAMAYKTVEFVSEFGGKGEGPGKFSDKTRFAFDREGNIYVVDTENRCVQRLNSEGKPILKIAEVNGSAFMRPMDVAADGDLNIYVVDWKTVYIDGTDSPKIFNYGPCVHKFSREGKFIASFTLDNLSQKANEKERAVAAVDMDGKFALMIIPEKPKRNLLISADLDGNVYVLDQDFIYKMNSSGEVLLRFAGSGGGPGQLDGATDIDVDEEGNVYVADTGNNRIAKFSPDGKFLLSFGRKGDSDGQFTGDLYIAVAWDGTTLVADSAKYEKIFKTSLRHRKLINSTILVTGQDDPLIPRTRDFDTVIRRVQKFDGAGKFQEKILYRIDKMEPELRDMKFKAIDPDGNLYLVDKDRLAIRKYSPGKPIQWPEVDKTLTYRVQHNQNRSKIDNFYDPDAYFDFEEREDYTQMTTILRLRHDLTEVFRVGLTSSLTYLDSKVYNYYPGEYADADLYVQDDITTDKYMAARMRIDFSLILDHDPFKYRVGDLFLYFSGGKYDFDIKATDVDNERHLDEHLWWANWAVGVRYDMGRSLRLSLIAAQQFPAGFMNYEYTYIDESGELYATGSGSGVSTEVYIAIDGAF